MKKGFTLIELLAVIVILAIIALIATPIILGIINDAREESNERSIELYASAVRNGIAAHQLRGNEVEAKTYKSSELTFVEYDGDVECDTVDIYEDGKIYIADCTVNGTLVDYTYGEKQEPTSTQVYKPQYYHFEIGFSGTVGSTAAPASPSTVAPEGKSFYLGYDIEDGKVSAIYNCFVRNNTEYCLKGNDNDTFVTNKTVLEDAYKDVEDACSFGTDTAGCSADGLSASADSASTISVGYTDGTLTCIVEFNWFECYEF